MARAAGREMTVEEFNEWYEAGDRMDAIAKAADEEAPPWSLRTLGPFAP